MIPGLEQAKSNLLPHGGLDMEKRVSLQIGIQQGKMFCLLDLVLLHLSDFIFHLLENPLRNSQAQGGTAKQIGLRSAACFSKPAPYL